jgi:hypothetical protein
MSIGSTRIVKGVSCHVNAIIAGAQSIAFHALMIFIQDTKDLVEKAVATSIKRDMRSDDEGKQEHGKGRKMALLAWKKCTHPLSWSAYGKGDNDTYALLVTILNQSNMDPRQALTESPT